MESLNAPSLKPFSLLRNNCRRRKSINLVPPRISSYNSKLTSPAAAIHGGLALLSSLFMSPLAKALTYEEALELSAGGADGLSGFDANGFVDTVIGYGTDNPVVVAGGVAALGVPLVLSQLLKSPKAFGIESARKAYEVLGEDPGAQLVDIRASTEVREVGVPDVKGLGKKAVSISYKGEDKAGFLKRLGLKFKEPETTTLFILDKFDGNSELVAELVTVNGFKAAYAIKDGAEGPRGWLNSGLPWTAPSKGLNFDFSSLTEAVSDLVGEGSDPLSVTLGVAAAAGLGALAFTEVETLLQLLGSAAIIQFASKKLLFAEDRKATLKQVDEFLTTNIAPKDLLGEIKEIGQALLPSTGTSKALPAPPESSPVAAEEPVALVNSVPKPEVKAESVAGLPRPLSPYPSYSDLKPPTSPTPQKPAGVNAEPIPQKPAAVIAESTPEVDSVPEVEAKAELFAGFSRPLSPYAAYPDLKPPTSPTPSKP